MNGDLAAIFFDFDGVLVESVHVKTSAFARLYEPYGSGIVSRVISHHEAHGGMSRFQKFRHYHEEFLRIPAGPETIDGLAERFGELVEDAVVNALPVPGALEFLEAHAGTAPAFIVSGTPEDELKRIVQRRGLSRFFQEVCGSPASKTDILRQLIDRHRLDPARCLMIGDALGDAEAAFSVGMAFVGRLLPGESSPFPDTVVAIPDLTGLDRPTIRQALSAPRQLSQPHKHQGADAA